MATTDQYFRLPSARPYAYEFPFATTALIIIDIQRDFVDPGGFGSVQCGNDTVFSKARSIVPAVQKVLDIFRSVNGHVIHTREGHQADLADLPASKKLRQISAPSGHHTLGIGDNGPMGRLLVRGEYGHDIIDELTPFPGESVIDKPGKGSFWGTGLHRELLARGITHLLFAGVTTECCVATTVRECNDRGFQCCVLQDCTAGFDAQQVTTALDTICGQDGLFGFVGSSTDFLAATSGLVPACDIGGVPLLAGDRLPSIGALLHHYRKGTLKPAEVIHAIYDRIDRCNSSSNKAVWITLKSRAQTLAAAEELSAKYASKPLPPLFCIPFSVKDNIDVACLPTTSALPSLSVIPCSSAPAVQHVLDAGALVIGKVNLDQLATGLAGTRSPYGLVHSVFSNEHLSGGSSSGSAVSVAAGLVAFSLGTDTAGSGRVPAALNHVVGLKPTLGTVSARGVVPAVRSLDTISVMANSIDDARMVWRTIARYDPDDAFAKPPSSLAVWHSDFRGIHAAGFTFAVPPVSALQVCSPTYRAQFDAAVSALEARGGRRVSDTDFDYTPFERAGALLYNGALLYERVDSIGVDVLSKHAAALHPTTQKVLLPTLNNPPSAFTIFADQLLRRTLTHAAQRTFDKLRGGIDVLVVPSVPKHPRIADMEAAPLALNAEMGTFTHFGNVLDLCGVSVPFSMYEEDGVKLPFGITLLGGSGMDARVLGIAEAVEGGLGSRQP
ncbi:glutamyl-tRNA amidotransferase subunit A [Paraphaeosphaeria sporulosa]|uniref:Glutamyl-tRNA amidotransferase subunit A n=1 Tax=Paraphaeosphaeria sporulosa TaxID=1460663 RepID=A0A177C3Z3_9PLEO|nr:glutamyl-tRNA amidotransferase subunit A [Paraphaeosphaeria sporulosa]OAG01390.1 glutamyl-tRNA amidotransferase subunit A [Paraphaeosphaeria sporulosa]